MQVALLYFSTLVSDAEANKGSNWTSATFVDLFVLLLNISRINYQLHALQFNNHTPAVEYCWCWYPRSWFGIELWLLKMQAIRKSVFDTSKDLKSLAHQPSLLTVFPPLKIRGEVELPKLLPATAFCQLTRISSINSSTLSPSSLCLRIELFYPFLSLFALQSSLAQLLLNKWLLFVADGVQWWGFAASFFVRISLPVILPPVRSPSSCSWY